MGFNECINDHFQVLWRQEVLDLRDSAKFIT